MLNARDRTDWRRGGSRRRTTAWSRARRCRAATRCWVGRGPGCTPRRVSPGRCRRVFDGEPAEQRVGSTVAGGPPADPSPSRLPAEHQPAQGGLHRRTAPDLRPAHRPHRQQPGRDRDRPHPRPPCNGLDEKEAADDGDPDLCGRVRAEGDAPVGDLAQNPGVAAGGGVEASHPRGSGRAHSQPPAPGEWSRPSGSSDWTTPGTAGAPLAGFFTSSSNMFARSLREL